MSEIRTRLGTAPRNGSRLPTSLHLTSAQEAVQASNRAELQAKEVYLYTSKAVANEALETFCGKHPEPDFEVRWLRKR